VALWLEFTIWRICEAFHKDSEFYVQDHCFCLNNENDEIVGSQWLRI
jgi:hypothetical protein